MKLYTAIWDSDLRDFGIESACYTFCCDKRNLRKVAWGAFNRVPKAGRYIVFYIAFREEHILTYEKIRADKVKNGPVWEAMCQALWTGVTFRKVKHRWFVNSDEEKRGLFADSIILSDRKAGEEFFKTLNEDVILESYFHFCDQARNEWLYDLKNKYKHPFRAYTFGGSSEYFCLIRDYKLKRLDESFVKMIV